MKSIKVKGINECYFAKAEKFGKNIAITTSSIDGCRTSLLITKANWEKLKKV